MSFVLLSIETRHSPHVPGPVSGVLSSAFTACEKAMTDIRKHILNTGEGGGLRRYLYPAEKEDRGGGGTTRCSMLSPAWIQAVSLFSYSIGSWLSLILQSIDIELPLEADSIDPPPLADNSSAMVIKTYIDKLKGTLCELLTDVNKVLLPHIDGDYVNGDIIYELLCHEKEGEKAVKIHENNENIGENEGVIDFFKEVNEVNEKGRAAEVCFSVDGDSSAADLNIMKLKMIKNLSFDKSDKNYIVTNENINDNNSNDNNDSNIKQNLKIISDQISSSQALSCSTIHSILNNKLEALKHSMSVPPPPFCKEEAVPL